MGSRRADYGASFDTFLAGLGPEQRAICEALRDIIRDAVPGVGMALKWGMPVFEKDGLLCYLRTSADRVTLGFYDHRDKLDDPEGRLVAGSGRGAHVPIGSPADVRADLLAGWVRKIAALNKGE